ncbi:protein HAPLESS 2-B isoform X3 [Panicum miliaceum]|uniref:Protein HAPLESS 2-B isoform X3 n=1 Tax=Panicum miliaceum TaxID=4540 RepID=A0A3L6QLA6_PANMI|nr:protein HAPLESS 2-B isoform X3 [Panicum miliaceum]
MAVPSGVYSLLLSGGEASLVTKVVEVDRNDTQANVRDRPVMTINKTAAYVEYALTYLRAQRRPHAL